VDLIDESAQLDLIQKLKKFINSLKEEKNDDRVEDILQQKSQNKEKMLLEELKEMIEKSLSLQSELTTFLEKLDSFESNKINKTDIDYLTKQFKEKNLIKSEEDRNALKSYRTRRESNQIQFNEKSYLLNSHIYYYSAREEIYIYMSSSITPPPPNKRFRNLYLSLTATITTELTTQQDPTKTKTTTGEVEVETVDDDVPSKTKSISILEKEPIKKSIKDDGLLKDSPTWYYLLLTSSATTIFSNGDDDDDSVSSGDDGKAPSTNMIDMMSEGDIDTTSQKKQQPICCQIQILAYNKNKSSWKHTHQQLSKIILLMMSSSSKQPNLHRGRSDDDNIFHPPNPPQGGKQKQPISLLPFHFQQQKWECTQWEWEEVSMMAFKQRFNSLLLQRRQQARTAASQMDDEFAMLEEEESNPQHRPGSLVFDQYFSSHQDANAATSANKNALMDSLGGSPSNNLCEGKSQEEEDLYQQQLQGESKKINKKGRRRRLPSLSSTTTDTKNHFPSRRQKPPQPVKLTTDLVSRVCVEEFLETNPSVDQFLKFQKCKLLIDQISKHQQQQDLYLDQADSDCPSAPSSEDFQYKWPPHLDKLQFPIIWQWFSQWHQPIKSQPMTEEPQSRSNDNGGSHGAAAEEEDIVCKVEPSSPSQPQEEKEFLVEKGGDSHPPQNEEEGNNNSKMIEEQSEKQNSHMKHPPITRRRFKALVLYSEERGVGKTCLAKSFVYNNQNWIIHCRNKFNADQFKLIEEARLLLIDDFNFDPKIHHECFKALVTSEPTGIRDAYLNLQFKHGLPTIICTNDTKFYEYLLKSPDFQHDCMFSDVSGQYLGPPHTRQRASSSKSAAICADPKTLSRFQQLTRGDESMPPNEAAEEDEEDEETMFRSAYNNNNRGPTRKRRNYQQLLLREAEAFLNPRRHHRNRGGPIYDEDDDSQHHHQNRRRKIKNNNVLYL
jgi:hypothetical protein